MSPVRRLPAASRLLIRTSLVLCLLGGKALGQGAPFSDVPAPLPSNQLPAQLQQVGIDQKLDAQLPLDLTFRDEAGQSVRLGDYFGKRPVILTLVYYECPMLCTMVLNDTLRSLKVMPLQMGKDYDVLTVSFNPRETPELAAKKKQTYVKQYNGDKTLAAAGWHFLTGDEPAIRQLTDAVGFRYRWDQASQQYAHPSGIIVLTPEGKISRYFFGIDYAPKDLRLSLVDASQRKVGSLTDTILLYCFHYDPATGKYTLAVRNAIRVGAVLTVVGLGAMVALLLRRERRAKALAHPPHAPDVHPGL